MKLFKGWAADPASQLPKDQLTIQQLATGRECFQGGSGIPATADFCAYEPIQRLLAVATSDGRVHVVGGAGVELSLRSQAEHPAGTQQLLFLLNRGAVCRLAKDGLLELWAVDHASGADDGAPLCALEAPGDAITCAAAMQLEPYVLFGCASGAVRAAALVNASGSLAAPARQARGVQLLPYQVLAAQLEGQGAVTHLEVASEGPVHRMLAVHSGSGASVWDVRAQELIAVIGPFNSRAPASARPSGAVSSSAWLTRSSRGDFATGHVGGDINLWALPTPSEVQPLLLAQLRVAAAPSRPVHGLLFVAGDEESLMVFGGQHEDHPDGLVLLPLPERKDLAEDWDESAGEMEMGPREFKPLPPPRKLPWLGSIFAHSLVPAQGGLTGCEDPSAVVVLMEGGELVAYELAPSPPSQQQQQHAMGGEATGGGRAAPPVVPQHFQLPFQAAPMVTAARLRLVPTERVPLQGLQGASMRGLWEWGRSAHSDPVQGVWRWVLGGGEAAALDASAALGVVHCTGHDDGSVRLWDMQAEAPLLLGSVPSAAAAAALGADGAPRAVTCVEFAWEQGLLITGHRGGEVRMYQFSEAPKSVRCITFDAVGAAGGDNRVVAIEEPPGMQLRLRTRIHGADVSASAYSPACKMVAAADAGGAISLIALGQPAVLWLQAPFQSPVVSLSLAQVPLPLPRERFERLSGVDGVDGGAPVRAVVAVAADGSAAALDTQTGFFLAKAGALRPKNASAALHLELLDATGAPLWMARDVADLVAEARGAGGTGGDGDGSRLARLHLGGEPQFAGPLSRSDPDGDSPACCGVPGSPRLGSGGGSSPRSGAGGGGGGAHTPLGASGLGKPGREARIGGSDARMGGGEEGGSDAEGGGGEGVGGKESEEEEGEEEADIDELLARAAAQVEAQDRSRHRASRPGSRSASTSRSPVRTPGVPAPDPAADPAAALAAKLRPVRSGIEALPVQEAPTRSPPPPPACPPNGPPIMLQDPPAAYALVASADCLRLYTMRNVVCGDRTAVAKVPLSGPLKFASAFSAGGAPALVALVAVGEETRVQLFTLPAMHQVLDTPLSHILLRLWRWPKGRAAERTALVTACTRRGQLALLGPQQELVRLALATGQPPLQRVLRSYDWELAHAAHCAALAQERIRTASAAAAAATRLRSERSGSPSRLPKLEHGDSNASSLGPVAVGGGGGGGGGGAAEDAADATSAPVGSLGKRQVLLGFVHKIGNDLHKAGGGVAKGFSKAGGEVAKGLQVVKQALEEDLPSILATGKIPGSSPQPDNPDLAYPHPPLETVFTTAVAAAALDAPGRSASLSSYGSGGFVELTSPLGARAATPAAPGPAPAPSLLRTLPARKAAAGGADGARSELLAGGAANAAASHGGRAGSGPSAAPAPRASGSGAAGPPPGGPMRVRTASEIRAAYGRAPLAAEGAGARAAAAQGRADGVGAIMSENQRKLGERGEKLAQLQDKTADLEESAAGFASMAQQLAERERARARWFGGP